MSKEKVDVYSIVTDRIIDLLEQGVVPWHKPWAGGSNQFPINYVSKKAYRGLNVWLLFPILGKLQASHRVGRSGQKGREVNNGCLLENVRDH